MEKQAVVERIEGARRALAAAGTWDAFLAEARTAWDVLRDVMPDVRGGGAEEQVLAITLVRDLVRAAGASDRLAALHRTREVRDVLVRISPVVQRYRRAVEIPMGERVVEWDLPEGVRVPEPVLPPLGVDRAPGAAS